MPTYKYTAVSKKGEYVSGEETAKDSHDLARMLRAKGLVLTEAEGEGAKKRALSIPNPLSGFFGVPLTDKLMFMRNLKVMVAAGIPLPKTLEILSSQAKSGKLKKALQDMKERVLQGHQLSDSMEAHPAVFPELFYNMIRTGEESGTLEMVLTQLTLQLEREHDLRSKIQGALIYPAVIVLAMIGIGILMLIMVVPPLADTFEELGVELPASTRLVISFADFLTERWYVALALLLGAVAGAYQALKTRVGKSVADTVLLRIPIAGSIIRKVNTAFFARTMSSLIGAGIPMVRSLEVTSTVLSNVHFKRVLLE
ncbi:MAG: type II secretion system F family protein, partial [bacterium]|nr:type II secretion system F family protein [bacterium]